MQPTKKILNEQLIIPTVEIAKEAGEAITEIYNSGFDYQLKKDLSPITAADNLSHKIITERLQILTPEIPYSQKKTVIYLIKLDHSGQNIGSWIR